MSCVEYDESDFIQDPYEHATQGLFYTLTSLPGKGFSDEVDKQICAGCHCDNDCTAEQDCSCLIFGNNFERNEDGDLILLNNKLLNKPIFECNFHCKCFGRHCSNRNIQFGPLPYLEVFRTSLKGFGLRTNRNIRKGHFICEYAGEIIGTTEATIRMKHGTEKSEMNYVFILKEHFSSGLFITCIDPKYIGNIGRYINHSCKPNSAIVPVRVNSLVPKLCVFAICDISEGDEISYDYSGECQSYTSINEIVLSPHTLKNEVIQATGILSTARKPCYCEQNVCKKYLPYNSV